MADHPEAFALHSRTEAGPGPLTAAAALAGMILVWLCALPFAVLAFCVLGVIEAVRDPNERLRRMRARG